MSEDDHSAHAVRHWILLILLTGAALILPALAPAENASVGDPGQSQNGTVVGTRSDKRVVQTGRWMVVRQFTVNLEVQCSNHLYCGEITTTVTNEVDDLMASKGQAVECSESGHDLDLTLKNGRRVKAHQVPVEKCGQN